MGKRLITQRRGRGTPRYKAPSHKYKYKLRYSTKGNKHAEVIKLINDVSRSSPLAILKLDTNEEIIIPAPMGIREKDIIIFDSNNNPGNISTLGELPEGTLIYNIEVIPGSHGKFCRAAGTFSKIITKTKDHVLVQLPSKKKKKFHPKCRATIGVIAGSGRKEKPIVKAGKKHHMMKARNKLYPITSGVAMNAVDHPFGSGRGRHMGKSGTPPKNSPPGRNVGQLRAKRTGKKK